MAIGTLANFKIYNDQFNGGVVETLTQVSDIFNEQSRGAIQLGTEYSRGHFQYESFFQTGDWVSRRDITSVADVEDGPITQGEFVSVKVNRKFGPKAMTLDAFKKIGETDVDNETLSFMLGTQVAKDMQVEMANGALAALVAALGQTAVATDVKYTVPSNGDIGAGDALIEGIALFGDRADLIECWVMHSKVFYKLVGNQFAGNIFGVSAVSIAEGTAATLGKPVVIIDSPSLYAGSPRNYYTLGLTRGALQLDYSEPATVVSQLVTGKENLAVRVQGEYAYNYTMKGFAWDVQNGGVNPTNNALGTGTNWDKVVASYKDLPGVLIQSRG